MRRRNRYPFARPDGAASQPPAASMLAPSVPAPVVVSPVDAPVSAEDSMRAEIEALKAQLAAAQSAASTPSGARNVCRVGWSSVHYGGRDHAPGAPFPFDLVQPPADIAPGFVESLEEGVHFVWSAE